MSSGFSLVGAAGFEPATPWSQTRCANRTAPRPEQFFHPNLGDRFGNGTQM